MRNAKWLYGVGFLVVLVGCTDLNSGPAEDGSVSGVNEGDGGPRKPGTGGMGGAGGRGGASGAGARADAGAGAGGGGADGGGAGGTGEDAGGGGSDGCTAQDLYADADGDGQGNAEVVMSACEGIEGYVTQAGDCDDECAACYVGGTEDCDGKDNDCDGELDELDARLCGSNVGTCKEGVQACVDGAWGACDGGSLPGEEACDGELDENCDGSVDEACPCDTGTSQPCGTDVGACTAGTQSCVAGAWSECAGAVGEAVETCNAIDDDCDDAIDEKLEQACGTNAGECTAGLQRCSAGAWGVCAGEVKSAVELCDNLDNDCDGTIDDGLTRTCGRTGGECRQGTQICRAGVWDTTCPGSVDPTTEVCDAQGRNEDCDAETNEGCACTNGASEPCGNGNGTCVRGSHTCSGGQWGVCTGGKGPGTEVCDAARLDEDCDTMINEGCNCTNGASEMCGVTDTGPCSLGTRTCSAGQWGGCSGNRDPGTETCNGIDDDCDSSPDDGNLCTSGVARRCVGGRCVQCVNHDECGGAEVCNADGRCETACGNGVIDSVRAETCDFASGTADDAFFCNHTNCKRTAYRKGCSDASQCGSGETCSRQFIPNHCAYPCTGTGACMPPPPSGYSGTCVMGACLLACKTNVPGTCPSGTACNGIIGTDGVCGPPP